MDSEVYIYDDNNRPIDHIEFSILRNNEIKNISALDKNTVGIDIAELYDGLEPKRGGLIDTRMGSTNNHIDCTTCGLNTTYCVGHFGHIELAEPVFHMGYVEYVKKILSCVCLKCSKLLVYKNEKDLAHILQTQTGKNRLNEISKLTKSVQSCQKKNYGCGTPTTKIKLEKKKSTLSVNIISEIDLVSTGDTNTEYQGKKKLRQIITPADCINIFKNISDTDCKIMGLDPTSSRPEDMIHKIFPVPPVSVRPSVKAEYTASSTMEDDLTIKLADIMKANIRLRKHKESLNEASVGYGMDYAQLLQYHIATYYDNDSMSLPRSEQRNKVFKSLTARLKSKTGRIRFNLMGKRVDFSARSVITADPSLDVNQLGVPINIAKNITFPEIVTPYNIKKLQNLVNMGRKWPGANFVYKTSNFNSGKRVLPIDLRFKEGGVELRYGDIVERHIVTGDTVLLNRQPSLHKSSMLGHVIKVIDNDMLSTFRLNVAVTTPYNADFDGDEMNIFIPQSVQTMIELEEIANVKRQIITPTSSVPIIGVVQDSLIGAYNLTNKLTKISWKDAMDMVSYTNVSDLHGFKKKDYNGTDVFSYIIPSKINVNTKGVIINNGVLDKEHGRLSKTFLGPKKKDSIVHLILDEYGLDETQYFIDNTQRLLNSYNLIHGSSVHVGDLIITNDLQKQINTLFETKKLEVQKLITELEDHPDLMDVDIFEMSVYSELNTIVSDVSKLVMQNIKEDNTFNILVSSGSKGSDINIGQMSGCVGQQAVIGKRPEKKINGRALAYFPQSDDSAKARGFVENSFINGTDPEEFVFHNMSSREGLIDTAIKTAESGYIQRRLIKTMEDISVKYDGTVRNSNNDILQFIYGDSGIDSVKQFNHVLKIVDMDNKEMEKMYKLESSQLTSKFGKKDNDSYFQELLNYRYNLRDASRKISLNYKIIENIFMLPVNYYRIINNIRNSDMKSNEKLTPEYILDKLDSILEHNNTMLICMSENECTNKNSMKYKDEMTSKQLFKYSLHEFLSPKRCIYEYKFNKLQFDEIIKQIKVRYNNSIIEAGEMVGVIATQSIGEPVTQLTLDTFHSAGIGGKGTTSLGVPRTKELLNLSKNMKTPQMGIYLKKELCKDKDYANKIESYIKFTTIKDLRKHIDVYYDPLPFEKDGFMDEDGVHNIFYSLNPSKYSCQSEINSLPWLMRIVLDNEKLMNKDITLLDIKSKFCNFWEKRNINSKNLKKEDRVILEKITQCAILSNNNNDTDPIIHIRFDMSQFNFDTIVQFTDRFVDSFKLKGLDRINDVDGTIEERVVRYGKDGSLEKDNEYVIYTKGVNLVDIRYINGIDLQRTLCNDINHIYNIFGVEAARMALLKEFNEVLSSNKVNHQHISMLVDVITHTGNLISVDRHRLNKIDSSPLARASFEKNIEQFVNAAVFSEVDNMDSVSARIMAGLVIKGGTGLCNLKLDTKFLEESEHTIDIEQKYKKTYNEIGEDQNMKDIISSKGDKESSIFMPT